MKKSLYISLVLSSFLNADLLDSIKTDGYIRLGVQTHKVENDKTYKSDAIGGKLHFESKKYHDMSFGGAIYTTNRLSHHDKEGVPFFADDGSSYTMLSEAYLKADLSYNTIMIGRQVLDTPFADSDDIGMIPNTFEAVTLINKAFKDTTVVLSVVNKWSGVDAPKPQKWTKLQNNKAVSVFGVNYSGFKDWDINGWYYELSAKNPDDLKDISYIDATYSKDIGTISYELGLQYAKQTYKENSDAKIYGATVSADFKNGLTLNLAYNKSKNHSASNGFGGGPYYINCEHITLAEVGKDGSGKMISFDVDMSNYGVKGLSFSYEKLYLKDKDNKKAYDTDYILSYDIRKNLNLTAIYSKTDDYINNDKFKNLRVFINKSF